jgi:UDP-N-acetylmuramoyl-tripeptide--D-alanyl-D-alanine ligase
MELRTSDLAAATGGRLEGPDVVVEGATADSRDLVPGQLFVPIIAERDGHDFVEAALAAGAAAYLTAREPVGGTAVVVEDTLVALGDAGRLARSRLRGAVVGITGSVGKTSTKDLLAAALAPTRRVAASERSYNNEIGVPLTLLRAPGDCDAVAVEMGARGIGHIALLCSIARPTVGIVTRVAAAHTELLGSLDDVARAKGELVESLPSEGTAVLSASDPRVAAMADRTQAEVVTFGEGGDVRAVWLELDDQLRPTFTITSPWGSAVVELPLRGRHMVDNALAAAAAAMAVGASPADVAEGLSTATLSPWRMELVTAASGARILNDAYNANPESMRAALESLAALPAERRTAVLGVMAELGPEADAEHARITSLARELGIRTIAVGAPAYAADVDVADLAAAAEALGALGEGDAVLVKGSRVAGLERLAADLVDRR